MLDYPGGPDIITKVLLKRVQEESESERRLCDNENKDLSYVVPS